ncbi:MAG: carbon-nitrogen hydrolase family protein [Trueperaceae bacterium]|nr:MAG: carbon-nitrogen hydrolase family protein [Trueperaceae bacterium]
MRFHLIAVQPRMELEHYRSAEVFKQKVLSLTKASVAGLDEAPKLVAFPEAIGLPLLFTIGDFDRIRGKTNSTRVIWELLRTHWQEVFTASLRHGVLGLPGLVLSRALPVYRAYQQAFAEAARCYGVTIVAGSCMLPPIDEEPVRGVYITGKRVYNTAYTFGPTGSVLGVARKVYLNPGTESSIGLSSGNLSDVKTISTPVGRVGVAICLDGFHTSVVDHFDGQRADIIVQPSANHAPWMRPWPRDPSLLEGEAWLRFGLRKLIQGRLHIRYAVNPMLVGEVFELKPRGRSSILVNQRFLPASVEGVDGVLALAQTSDSEEIVRAVIHLA